MELLRLLSWVCDFDNNLCFSITHQIAGEMLVAMEPFISRNIHPTVIVRACYKALESALRICREIAVPIDIYNREEMMKLLRSTIGTKFSSRFGDLIVR